MADEIGAGHGDPPAETRVVWTTVALEDIDVIRAYIAADDSAAASRLAIALVAAGDSLISYPFRGSATGWFEARRLVVMRRYLIYYRVEEERVVILRVRHAARRPLA